MTQYHSLMGQEYKTPATQILAQNPKPKPRPVQAPSPAPVPAPAPSPAPRQHRPVDQAEATRIASILRNGDKTTYLTQLKLQSPRKFYSIETKNACSTVGCYNIWQNISSLSPAPSCPTPSQQSSVPPPPTQAAV
jgi:hypothetical protein